MKEYTMSKYLSKEDLYNDMKNDLINILKTMDIPANRINPLDLNWLRRNLFIKNSEHPKYFEAHDMIKQLQVYEYRKAERKNKWNV